MSVAGHMMTPEVDWASVDCMESLLFCYPRTYIEVLLRAAASSSSAVGRLNALTGSGNLMSTVWTGGTVFGVCSTCRFFGSGVLKAGFFIGLKPFNLPDLPP